MKDAGEITECELHYVLPVPRCVTFRGRQTGAMYITNPIPEFATQLICICGKQTETLSMKPEQFH